MNSGKKVVNGQKVRAAVISDRRPPAALLQAQYPKSLQSIWKMELQELPVQPVPLVPQLKKHMFQNLRHKYFVPARNDSDCNRFVTLLQM